MIFYAAKVKEQLQGFKSWNLENIDISKNDMADALARLASSEIKSESNPVYWDELFSLSILSAEVNEIQTSDDYRTPILQYIEGATLPKDKRKARSHRATVEMLRS